MSCPSFVAIDTEYPRARKRQRTDTSSPLSRYTLDQSTRTNMRLADSDQDSQLSASPDFSAHAGPSTLGLDRLGPSNGHTNGTSLPPTNGFASSMTNGSMGGHTGNSVVKQHGKAIAKVNLPGTTLYDDSYVDREEFVRLVIQSLRDVGYV
jgi:WD repeat-containing protein 26